MVAWHIAWAAALLVVAEPSSDEDDPKIEAAMARWRPRPAAPPSGLTVSATLVAEEEDPKLQRAAGRRERGPRRAAMPHPTPVAKLAYRRLSMIGLDRSELPFNAVSLNLFPLSTRFVRLGVDSELGIGSGTLEQRPFSAWYLAAGLDLGLHYPWRVTPFIDGRFIAGLMGGDVAGTDVISWTYMVGVDTGIELYLFGRLYLSAAIGWVRPLYKGIDINHLRGHPLEQPVFMDFGNDSFTFKVGIGL